MYPHRSERPIERSPDIGGIGRLKDSAIYQNYNTKSERKMIMKQLKCKATAILSTVLLTSVFALGSMPATAANDTPITLLPDDAAETVNFDIAKDIVLFNTAENTEIYAPNVTYTYSVAVASPESSTITAPPYGQTSGSMAVKVRQGIAGAVKIKGNADTEAGATANVQFGKDATDETKLPTNLEGTDLTKVDDIADICVATENLNVAIDASVIYDATGKKNPPGVYRYKITDTTLTTNANTLKNAGITRDTANYDSVLYLDVYTKYNADKSDLEVYGYVLFKNQNGSTDEKSFDSKDENTDGYVKVSGFDAESEAEYDTTGTDPALKSIYSDQYHTYNAELKKVTEGALADANNKFPFKVDLANSTIKNQADFYYVMNDTESEKQALTEAGAWTFGTVTATDTATLALKDGDVFQVIGLPAGTTFTAAELNNTADLYTTDVTLNGDELVTAAQIASGATCAMGTAQELKNLDDDDAVLPADVFVFTNTLDVISVTGLFFNIAPFVAMFVFGIAMIVLYSKNRKHNESDNMI